MLKAVISHNEQATIVELPMDRLSLQYELSQIGIRRLAKDIPIMDEEDQPISVKLYSESDIGQNLAMLFRPSHSLEDANVCAHAVVHARPEVQDEIEQSIVYGQYHSPQAVLADIKAMTTDLIAVTVNYYCPLQVRMTDEEYGDWYEVDNGYALDNKRAIRELLQKEQNEDTPILKLQGIFGYSGFLYLLAVPLDLLSGIFTFRHFIKNKLRAYKL